MGIEEMEKGVRTSGRIHDELHTALLERACFHSSGELGCDLAGNGAAGVVDGELLLIREGLGGGEGGQEGAGEEGELHRR